MHAGIIDATTVEQMALPNAASIVSLLLTHRCPHVIDTA
jgi:hypothetical protein